MDNQELNGTANPLVKKSNAIARAKWELKSIWEPRIVALVASKVKPTDTDFQTYKTPIAELCGVKDKNLSGDQYREVVQAIEFLGKAIIKIKGDGKRDFRIYNIFAMCGYEKGYLIAQFHPDLKPHFLQLQAKFTSYNLNEYLALPSTYSQQLFEILKSWSGLERRTIRLLELHEMLSTPDYMRQNFKDFRVRVLDKAFSDIYAHTGFQFSWRAIKSGRSVQSIEFVFSDNLIKIINDSNKIIKTKKQQRANNKTAKAAIDCMKIKVKCSEQDNKPSICKLCKQMALQNDSSLNKEREGEKRLFP